jgi:hypothetical protein
MSKIEGPLGIWPWPILNALVEMSDSQTSGDGVSVKSYNVIRDDEGRIENVEIVEGIGDE